MKYFFKYYNGLLLFLANNSRVYAEKFRPFLFSYLAYYIIKMEGVKTNLNVLIIYLLHTHSDAPIIIISKLFSAYDYLFVRVRVSVGLLTATDAI